MKGKVLRGVGLALIAAPEPFTTPVGVGLLAASWLISRSQEAQKRAYLQHILTEYFHTYRPFGYGAGFETRPPVQQHVWEKNPAAQKRGTVAFGSFPAVTSRVYQPGKETDTVHHTLDLDRVRRRVDTGGTRRGFEGIWGAKTRMDLKVVHHEIRRDLALASAAN